MSRSDVLNISQATTQHAPLMKKYLLLCFGLGSTIVSAIPGQVIPRQGVRVSSIPVLSANQTTTSSSSESSPNEIADVSVTSSHITSASSITVTVSSAFPTSTSMRTNIALSPSTSVFTSSTSAFISDLTTSVITSSPFLSSSDVDTPSATSLTSHSSVSTSLSSTEPSVSSNPSTRFIHKTPPPSSPKEMPSQIAQIASTWHPPPSPQTTCHYSKTSILESCLYSTYSTTIFLQDYITSLLQHWNKTSTTQLDYAWPYYLALDYERPTWKCSWTGDCLNQQEKPDDDTNTDILNAYFILESLENWTAYMRAHRKFIIESTSTFVDSTHPELSLTGVINQFSMSDRKPGLSNGVSGKGLLAIITYALSKLPIVGEFGEIGKAVGQDGFVQSPETPSDSSIEDIKRDFKSMMDNWDECLRQAFLTMQVDSEYALKLLDKGAFLKTQPKVVTDIWDDPKDWTSSQMINYRHWTIMQTFRAYGIFLHAEDANCDIDGKWTNQGYPEQHCMTSDLFNGNRQMFMFPVSWLSSQETSKTRRSYSKFGNLVKYNLTVQDIMQKAIIHQMPTNDDWNNIPFPENREKQYTSPEIDWEAYALASEVPGFWSVPVCYANARTVDQCVPSTGCCTGFNYGESMLDSPDCPWWASCYAWMSHYNHDNMGLDAWCAEKIGFEKGKGYYFGYQSMLYSREWIDQC